jgi:hypothetical protein
MTEVVDKVNEGVPKTLQKELEEIPKVQSLKIFLLIFQKDDKDGTAQTLQELNEITVDNISAHRRENTNISNESRESILREFPNEKIVQDTPCPLPKNYLEIKQHQLPTYLQSKKV